MVQIARQITAALVAVSLAFSAALPAIAQDAPQAQQQDSDQLDPDRVAAARDLLQATNTDAQFAAVIPTMFTQLKQSIPPSGPKMQEELDKVFEEIEKQFLNRRSEVLDQITILYARKFTADEMKALADFYRSPLAQKFIAAIPELTVEAMKIGNDWGREIAADAERKIRDEMRRRGFAL